MERPQRSRRFTEMVCDWVDEVFHKSGGRPYPVRIDCAELPDGREIFSALFVEGRYPRGVAGKAEDLAPIRALLALRPLFVRAERDLRRQVETPINDYEVIVPHFYDRFPAFLVTWFFPTRGWAARAVCPVEDLYLGQRDEAAIEEAFADIYLRMLDFMLECEQICRMRTTAGEPMRVSPPRVAHSYTKVVIDYLDRVVQHPELYAHLPMEFVGGAPLSGAVLFDDLFLSGWMPHPRKVKVEHPDLVRTQLALDALLQQAQEEVRRLIGQLRRSYAIVPSYWYKSDDGFIVAFGEGLLDIREAEMVCTSARFRFGHINPSHVEDALAQAYESIYEFICYAEGINDFGSAVARALEGV